MLFMVLQTFLVDWHSWKSTQATWITDWLCFPTLHSDFSAKKLLGCPYTRLWRSLVDWHCCCLGIMSYLVQFQFPVTVLIEPDQLGKSIKGTGMFLILPHLFMIMGTKLWSELRSMDYFDSSLVFSAFSVSIPLEIMLDLLLGLLPEVLLQLLSVLIFCILLLVRLLSQLLLCHLYCTAIIVCDVALTRESQSIKFATLNADYSR